MMATPNGREVGRGPGDDEEDEEEGEEEEEDEPAVAQAPVRPQPHVRQRARRSDAGIAKPAKSHQSNWQNKEADLLWGEILQKMQSTGTTPYEMKISVSINNPADGGLSQKLTEFEASSVMGGGDLSPSEALTRRVEDAVHLPSGYPGPRQYQIRFLWKNNSHIYAMGLLNLPSPQQILAIRAQQNAETTDHAPMPGLGQPPRQPQQQPAWQGPYYPPQYGYPGQQPQPPYMPPGYPPPYSGEMEQLRGELQREREQNARNQGMLEEIIRAQREGRAPNVPPPAPPAATAGLGAPPPQAIDVAAAIKAGIVEAVTLLGGVGMGRPQTQTSAMEASLLKATNEMVSGILHATLKQVSKGMERGVIGLGAPEEEEAEPAPIVPPPDPKDGLPFEAIELAQTWPNGSKVVYARSKETGGIHPLGAVMGNPYVMEQSGHAIAGLAQALTEAVKNIGKTGPHIVRDIPPAAQPAGLPTSGGGGGWGE
jgi:hypothetical protein